MLERTVAIKNEVLEPITFVPAYPTVQGNSNLQQRRLETEPGVFWGASILRKFGHRATVCLSGSSGPFRKKRLFSPEHKNCACKGSVVHFLGSKNGLLRHNLRCSSTHKSLTVTNGFKYRLHRQSFVTR